MKIAQALQEALMKLPATEVRYSEDRMTINDVLYRLIVEQMNDGDYADVSSTIATNAVVASSVADVDENDKVASAITAWVADLERWITEPHERDIWPEE